MGHISSVIMGDETHPDYPLTPGAILGSEHYGFKLIIDAGGKQTEETYGTQRPLKAVGFTKDEGCLEIHEENKYVSWLFDKKGRVVRKAQFLKIWCPDVKFVSENYGVNSDAGIDLINNY